MNRKRVCGALGFAPNFDIIKEKNAKGLPIFPWQSKKNKVGLEKWCEK